MPILYVGYRKFPTNRFVRNFCPYDLWEKYTNSHATK
jgi:hypothetical protein